MNKRFLVLVVVLALSLPALYADIGENFEKGGIGLSGSISYYNNFYYFLVDTEQRKFWSLDVSPGLEYFVADRVALGLWPWFYYEAYTEDPNNIDKYMSYGFRIGGDFAFVRDPAAQKGLSATIGVSIGFAFYPVVYNLIAGIESPTYKRTDLLFYFSPRLLYFLNDRLAPFFGITPQLGYILYYEDPSFQVDFFSDERLFARVTVTLGIAMFVPNKKASLFMNK